jgi:hypothetical protein
MAVDTEELDYMVRKILGAYPINKRWPINIIDEVFATIQFSKYVFYPQYKRMVGENGEHKYAVNPIIGKLVKEHTHLETIREAVPAKLSNLIESYTELGPTTNGND